MDGPSVSERRLVETVASGAKPFEPVKQAVAFTPREQLGRSLSWRLIPIVGLAALYYVSGRLGLLLAIPPGYATAVWPAAGFALAGLLLLGNGAWPGILIGSFFVNVGTSFDASSASSAILSIGIAASIGFGAAMQALAGAYLVSRKAENELELLAGKDVVRFLAFGGPVSCLTNATWGVITLSSFGLIEKTELPFSWVTWWVGDSIGVIVVVPMLLAWFGRPRNVWKRRRGSITVPLTIALTLVVLFFVSASKQEKRRIEGEFRDHASLIANTFKTDLTKYQEVIHSLHDFVGTTGSISGRSFKAYVQRSLERNAGLQALSWNPVVTGQQREAFERQRTQESPGFEITERDSGGNLVRAGDRDKYVVVSYIQPLVGNERALGYDVHSNPTRRTALDCASSAEVLIATDPITLVQEASNQAGMLFLLAAHEHGEHPEIAKDGPDRLRGFVVGVIRTGALLEESLRRLNLTNIDAQLIDIGGSGAETNLGLYRFDGQGKGQLCVEEKVHHQRRGLLWEEEFPVGQRSWRLRVAAGPQYLVQHRSWSAWGVLAGGAGFAGLLGGFLLTLTGRGILDQRKANQLAETNGVLADMLTRLDQRDRELARLVAAVEQSPDGIAILDCSENILHANHAFLRLTGCAPVQVRRLRLASLYEKAFGNTSWDHVFSLACQGESWIGRVRARRVDGTEYTEACTVAPIIDSQDRVVNVLLLKKNITRELRLEKRLAKAEKLQALGTLSGGIAHDFNNLLSPIVMYSEMLMRRAGPETKEYTRLERINSAAVEASRLVRQILNYSRPGNGTREMLSAEGLVRDCVSLFEMGLPPCISVECEFETGLPPMLAEPSQVHQVVMNLLTNAMHATKHQGGLLLCGVKACTPVPNEVSEFPRVAGVPCICIWVKDQGYGMSEEVRERIFEPFFSTKEVGEGTGMGLAVVRGIVEGHGGAITIQSELGRGTTAWVYLPVAGGQANAGSADDVSAVASDDPAS